VLSEKEQEEVKSLFEAVAKGQPGASVTVALSPDDQPVLITKPEFMRRMKEMQSMHGMGALGDIPDSYNVVVNTNHPLIAQKLLKISDESRANRLVAIPASTSRCSNKACCAGEALDGFCERNFGEIVGLVGRSFEEAVSKC
jgi:molecular chaperone HtpG